MHIRTVYLKVRDLPEAAKFWETFLQVRPQKSTSKWCEFLVGEVRLALLLNDFGDQYTGSSCVPVFECSDAELETTVQRALTMGATVVFDGLADAGIMSIVLRGPTGHEFEISKQHE